jgi:hypothetical protein
MFFGHPPRSLVTVLGYRNFSVKDRHLKDVIPCEKRGAVLGRRKEQPFWVDGSSGTVLKMTDNKMSATPAACCLSCSCHTAEDCN